MIKASRATVTGTRSTLLAPSSKRRQVTIRNTGTADVAVGGSDLTTTNGFVIPQGGSLSFDLDGGDNVSGIAPGGASQVVHLFVNTEGA